MKSEEKRLIRESIAHWKRMIAWVKKQNPKDPISGPLMLNAIKEIWGTVDCPLCKMYRDVYSLTCQNCPLKIKYGQCGYRNKNAWLNVYCSKIWEEWLKNAKIMLKQLKSL